MPRLIHLNGPPGVGKSTVAQMYADRHPGVLNLDTDQVVSLIGGWKDNFWETLKPARILAISMVETHLRTGHDVVMPQLVTAPDEIEGFETAVHRSGAEYREVVLLAEKQQALDRFACRAASGDPAHHRHIDEIVARSGGPALLSRIHDQLTEFLRGRPDCAVVYTDGRDPQQTYDAVSVVLADPDQAREPSRATTALRGPVGVGIDRVDELAVDDLRQSQS
ncbi:AAA family ATPase [Pseudonocardia alaniniphila]|uniref:ATP-binding protein n=1 Tax=Pseudonocardia alaniniphila TaxID=75291 RepID=A0ABS9TNB6_9PSEU|nr:AAA family ATPase [Pseudonocardia alaniniphila]MCH6169761.1 ATP-binding protein [Pseudonocardia alaniniphila]